MSTLIKIENVSHSFAQNKALSNVSFEVNEGEIMCVLGPSGCGKSTLLRLITGLELLQSGKIEIGDSVVATQQKSVPPERRNIGLVFQDFALFPHLSVLENVSYGIKSASKKQKVELATRLIESVGLADHIKKFPQQLSGGQQQRIALVRALAAKPVCLCLDEPFSGLDENLRKEVRELTLSLLKQNHQSAILVTHDIEEAAAVADRVLILNKGVVEQVGTPAQLSAAPNTTFVSGFWKVH